MTDTQEEYIQSLKKLKETEENVQKEIENRRKQIDDEIKKLQTDMQETIARSKMEGEKLIESYLEQGKKKATAEIEKIIENAEDKAKNISKQVNAQTAQEIIDILLKGVN